MPDWLLKVLAEGGPGFLLAGWSFWLLYRFALRAVAAFEKNAAILAGLRRCCGQPKE